MPTWGVQDLVNKWVKVNKTHVVYDLNKPPEPTPPQLQQQSPSTEKNDRLRPSSVLRKKSSPASTPHGDAVSWATKTETTTITTSGYNGKQTPLGTSTRSGLGRSNSQSDMLKHFYYESQQERRKTGKAAGTTRRRQSSKKKEIASSMLVASPQHIIPEPTPSTVNAPPPDTAACPNCHAAWHRLSLANADIALLRDLAQQRDARVLVDDDRSVDTGGGGAPVTDVMQTRPVAVVASKKKKKKRGSVATTCSMSVASERSVASVEGATAKEQSRRLDEMTLRHKGQIEMMTKERARWQNEMHLKLSKFALMCKELNEEAAKRTCEAQTAEEELALVKSERNTLVTQVQTLRGELDVHRRRYAENECQQQRLIEQQKQEQQRFGEEVGKRDDIIKCLTSRLKATMNTLEAERRIQRSRRIIFPSARGGAVAAAVPTSPRSEVEDNEMNLLREELAQSKEIARLATQELQETRRMVEVLEKLRHSTDLVNGDAFPASL